MLRGSLPPASLDMAQDALAAARQLEDPELIARALIACGMLAFYSAEVAQRFFDEAIDLVRTTGDRLALCQIRRLQTFVGTTAGDPTGARAAAEEGRDLAAVIGDRSESRFSRLWLSVALMQQGNLTDARRVLGSLADEVDAAEDRAIQDLCLCGSRPGARRPKSGARGASRIGIRAASRLSDG